MITLDQLTTTQLHNHVGVSEGRSSRCNPRYPDGLLPVHDRFPLDVPQHPNGKKRPAAAPASAHAQVSSNGLAGTHSSSQLNTLLRPGPPALAYDRHYVAEGSPPLCRDEHASSGYWPTVRAARLPQLVQPFLMPIHSLTGFLGKGGGNL